MSNEAHILVEVAVEPKIAADMSKLRAALDELARGDASVRYSADAESGQIILKATSEDVLEASLDAIRRGHGIEIKVGAPQVAYRERLTRSVEIDHTYKRQYGPKGDFARVRIRFEPLKANAGFVFANEPFHEAIPLEYLPGIERGLDVSRENGVIAGFPVIDFKATLTGGAYHEVDSSILAFEIAARGALRELKSEGAIELVEPIMAVTVRAPKSCFRAVHDDLRARGNRLASIRPDDEKPIQAVVPLAAMLGYASALAALSDGRATCTMAFSHYAPVPHDGDPSPFRPARAMRA